MRWRSNNTPLGQLFPPTARGPDPQNVSQQQARPLPSNAPPTTAKLRGVYNLDEINTIRKGVSPRPAKEEPTIHDWVEQPGAWDLADVLRDHKMFRETKYIDLDVYWAKQQFFLICQLPTTANPV